MPEIFVLRRVECFNRLGEVVAHDAVVGEFKVNNDKLDEPQLIVG